MHSSEIKDTVKEYIASSGTGALMISGKWGSGKSYFIKHGLLKTIREIPYSSPETTNPEEETFSDSFSNYIRKYFTDNNYFPIFVSLFGLKSIDEIKEKIFSSFLNDITKGYSKKIKDIKDGLKNLSKNFPKIKQWVDFSNMFEFKYDLRRLPKNVVLLLDDLERLTENIKMYELLGLINEISERNGLKVILIANQEHIKEKRSEELEFQEKVVEKVISYEPNVHAIIPIMAKEIGGEEFQKWISSNETLTESVLTRATLINGNNPVARFSNLRTIRFAINHFYNIFKAADSLPREKDAKESFLRFVWYYVLSLSIELKRRLSYEESIEILRDRDFSKVATVDLSLDDTDTKNPFEEEEDLRTAEEKKDEERLSQLREHFLKVYRKRYINVPNQPIYPLVVAELVDYIGGRSPLQLNPIVNKFKEFSDNKVEAEKERNKGEQILYNLMNGGYFNYTNIEIIRNLTDLYQEVKEGNLQQISSFVNAHVYLSYFADSLNEKPEEIYENIISGFDNWLRKRNGVISRLEVIHFRTIRDMIEEGSRQLYEEIDSRLRTIMDGVANEEEKKIVEAFTTDMRFFHDSLVPMIEVGSNSAPITEVMRKPFLDSIGEETIQNKLKNIEVNEVWLLVDVLKNRYNHSEFRRTILPYEQKFIRTLHTSIENLSDSTLPSHVMVRTNILPILQSLIL